MASDAPREAGRLGPPDHPLVIGVSGGEVTIGEPGRYWSFDQDEWLVLLRTLIEADFEAMREARAKTTSSQKESDPQ